MSRTPIPRFTVYGSWLPRGHDFLYGIAARCDDGCHVMQTFLTANEMDLMYDLNARYTSIYTKFWNSMIDAHGKV